MTPGRPIGTTKNPNRRRIYNPNGRLIDFEGPQFNRLINTGYRVNTKGTKLVLDISYKTPAIKVISNEDKIINPDSKRAILKTGVTFKNLAKKYNFDTKRNKFITRIVDPKSETKIKLNSSKFKQRIKHGYIYKKEDNLLLTPSVKTENALKDQPH